MNKRQRQQLANEVEERLDNELDFDLSYEISHYHQDGTSIVDVDIDIYDGGDDWPEDWDELVEDIISDIASDWGGWYSWEDSCISISVSDD